MRISVILSTYNQPDWLEKVLWGYALQTHADFELVVADDGSGPATRERIARFEAESERRVLHVWQEDDGFQKTRILNKAIVACGGDYLIFSDGDCIPRGDFVAVHAAHARPGRFLSGGYFKLPLATSQAITREDIRTGDAFRPAWLRAHGLPFTPKIAKLAARGAGARFLNAVTTTKPTWNGHNASGWKADLVAANGFDERMQYGGEDRELGERLWNAGLKSTQIRYSAVCVHLDHGRGYVRPEMIARNDAIRAETRRLRRTRTPFGIVKDGPVPA